MSDQCGRAPVARQWVVSPLMRSRRERGTHLHGGPDLHGDDLQRAGLHGERSCTGRGLQDRARGRQQQVLWKPGGSEKRRYGYRLLDSARIDQG